MGIFDKIKSALADSNDDSAETIAESSAATPELYATSISRLLQSEAHNFITIQDDGEACIQVAKVGPELSLNISPYPYSEDPSAKLTELGIVLPAGSNLQDWDADCHCQFGVPIDEANALADAVDAVFRGLYTKQEGYTVSVYMEA